jgi:hypothetical protein
MRSIVWLAVISSLLLVASPIWAGDPITRAMIEDGGGLEEFGFEVKEMLAPRVGSELAGLTIVEHDYHLNRPTLSYRLTFDTNAFIERLLVRVNGETGGQHTTAQLVMAYVLVFERQQQLKLYLGQHAGAALCSSQPERSAIDLGYRFTMIFRHARPDTVTYSEDGREEIRVLDRIGSFNHGKSSCEELDLGIHDAQQTLDGAVARMIEAIDSGAARQRFEIVDGPEDEVWRQRTLTLIKRFQ